MLDQRFTALLGRDEELAVLAAFLDRTEQEGACLVLTGDPGIGKSALLDAAAAMADASALRVLRGSGGEFEGDLPYATLHHCLMPLLDDLEILPPAQADALRVALGLGSGDPPPPMMVCAATLQLLVELSRDRPMVIAIDDTGWIDRASATVLMFLARRVPGTRIGLLAAARGDAEGIFSRSGLPVRTIAALDDRAAERLLGARFPSLNPRLREQVLAEAQGNPLALLELPTGLSVSGPASLRRLEATLPLTSRLHRHFAARIERLGPEARHVLLIAALNSTGDLRPLQALTADPIGLLDAATHVGLISVDLSNATVEFRHPLIRATVVRLASAGQLRAAHQALAEALANDPDRQVWHVAEAAVGPDEAVAARLEAAARAWLARGDSVGSVSALARAGGLSPEPADRARRLGLAAYVGADVTGDLRNVARLLSDPSVTTRGRRPPLEAAAAEAYALLNDDGDIVAAHRLLAEAIEGSSSPGFPTDETLMETLLVLFSICLWAERADLWLPYQAAIARLGVDLPEMLQLEHMILADPPRAPLPALIRLDVAIRGLEQERDVVRIERVARTGTYVDRVSHCRAALERVVADGRQGGAVATAINAMMHLCVDDWFTGRWDAAEELAVEGWDLCLTHGYGLPKWGFRLGAALVAAGRGHQQVVRDRTDEMLEWAVPRQIGGVLGFAHHARTISAITQGNYEEAYNEASQISPPGTLPPRIGCALWIALPLVEAALHSGHTDEAAAHAAALRSARVERISPRLALVSSAATAMTTSGTEALPLFEKALAIEGIEQWPFDVARVRLAYGQRVRRARSPAESRPQFELAMSTFRVLRAAPWVERAAAELRAAGAPVTVDSAWGLATLTTQEREVAALAATGLTNKQIAARLYVSPRTVSAHLYRVFPKLGITSRAALRDALD